MTWAKYIEKIKDGPISVLINPPTKEDCDIHGKFLAYFPKVKEFPLRKPTWGYLSVNYIEKNDPTLKPSVDSGEAGHYPLHLICSHWLPMPPLMEEDK